MISPTSPGSPPLKYRTREPQSPRKVIRQEAFRQPQKSPIPSSRPEARGKGGDTFVHDSNSSANQPSTRKPTQHRTNMHDNDDSEDPHDLAFPTKHIARASMVDSLVMSLDHYSPTSRGFDHSDTSAFRQHASSHSITSESEVRSTSRSKTSTRVPRADTIRSKSKEEQLAIIFGEDEDSHRSKAYAAQRAIQPSALKPKQIQHRSSTRSRSSSNSSSVDLGHLAAYAGRLGPSGTRRSQSFDFGSTHKVRQKLEAEIHNLAPTSYIIQGPEAPGSLSKSPSPGQIIARRNSGRSAKSVPGKKVRSGTVGATTPKAKIDNSQALPTIKNPTNDIAERRQVSESILEPLTTPRPGFFRRVFGSSRNASMTTSLASNPSPSSARPSQERSDSRAEVPRPNSPVKLQRSGVQSGTDISANKENHPPVTKKPSSFFRRRKKSATIIAPPSLRLTLDNSLPVEKKKDDQSPVSSLRAFMDPYLGTNADESTMQKGHHKRGSSLQSVINMNTPSHHHVQPKQEPTRNLEADFKQAKSSHNRQTSADLPKLQIPQTNIVPTDSGSVETSGRMDNPSSVTTRSPALDTTVRVVSPSLQHKDATRGLQKSPTPNHEQLKPVSRTSTVDKFDSETGPTNQSTNSVGVAPSATESEVSKYESAPSTPTVLEPIRSTISPHVHISHPSIGQELIDQDVEQARKILENPDALVDGRLACAWLGEGSNERAKTRKAYMDLFEWSGKNVLASLHGLCSKLALKGETQQVDRLLDAFAQRWCECNPNHGFRSVDVVHTICYSILLLNTDLHLADIGQKMTRTQFINNAMDPIKQAAGHQTQSESQSSHLKATTTGYTTFSLSAQSSSDRDFRSPSASSNRGTDKIVREDSSDVATVSGLSARLVETPFSGSQSGWENEVEVILKDFYYAISREPLPLFGQPLKATGLPNSNNNLLGLSGLRRTPSTLSKARSETRGREAFSSKSLGARFTSKASSRQRLGSAQGFGSSRTSFDDGSSAWSPMSSTWSKTSLGKTLTSMSVDSFGTEKVASDYQSSIGFANALSQAIIRDEQMDMQHEEGIKAAPLLEDESLELYGAPWAKEGMLKHKCHLEGTDKRAKDRNWNDCFAVIEKGWMRLFSFSVTAKTLRNKARIQKAGAGAIVGGGNWQDNAEEVWKFMLRHTIASTLPPPGYSKQRPYVWALSLPNGAVHLFSAGTPDIVKEFVSTANFWSARLSKEPMTGGVSSMEYGWSDAVINRALMPSDSYPILSAGSPRPSTQMSMRSSIDHGTGGFRPRLPGDRVYISDWNPPTQSLLPSQLLEVDQMKALQAYVRTVENELSLHNELRQAMHTAFTSRHPNANGGKAMANWERKSSYLLREIVKFGTYIDALQQAQKTKKQVYKMRKEDEEQRKDEKAERAFRRANEEGD